jgi:hypothetical protein
MGGLIASAIAGGLEGAGTGYAKEGHEKLKQEIEDERQKSLLALQEQMHVRAEDRRRVPYQRAAQAADTAVKSATRFDEDASGNVTRNEPTAAGVARKRAGAYEAEGLPEAASHLRSEALTADKLDLERSAIARREGHEQRHHEERMVVLNKQLLVQERQLEHTYKLNKNQSTALTTNVRFLVDNEIAKSPAAAFEMLRERMTKSPKETLLKMTDTLLRSEPIRYRGEAGRQKAVDDARSLIDQINGVDAAEAQSAYDEETSGGAPKAANFGSADDVRQAYRAGRIDRNAAERELGRFGYK